MQYSHFEKESSFIILEESCGVFTITWEAFNGLERFSTTDFIQAAKMFSDIKSVIECSKE